MFEVEVKISGMWEHCVYSKTFQHAQREVNRMSTRIWRIVRRVDRVAVAYHKDAYTTPDPDDSEPVADAPVSEPPFMVWNTETDNPVGFETSEDVIAHLQALQSDGEQLSDYVVQDGQGVFSMRADDWFATVTPLPVVAETETPAPVASRYLVINRVIDTEPMECETLDETLTVLYELREDGENLENWLVQEWQGDNLIESRNGRDWYYENVTRHKAGDVVEIMGIQHEVQANGILRQLPPVASTPVSGVRWLTRDEVIKFPFANSWKSLYYYGEDTYLFRYGYSHFADINGHAPKGAQKPRRQVSKSVQVCSTMNMQKGGLKAFKTRPNNHRKKPVTPTSRIGIGGNVIRPDFGKSYIRIAS